MASMVEVKRLIRSATILFEQPEFEYTQDQGMGLTTGAHRKRTIANNRKTSLARMAQGLKAFSKLRHKSKLKLLSTNDTVTAAVLAAHCSGVWGDSLLPANIMTEEPSR